MYYPSYRMRRLRRTPAIRDLVRETTLEPDDLVYPLFVVAGENVRPLSSMPGGDQLSVGTVLPEVREVVKLGVKAVLLFGIPERQGPRQRRRLRPRGHRPEAIRAIKRRVPGSRGHHRRVPVRVHRSRPLRRAPRRADGRQRRHPRAARRRGRLPRRGRRRHRRAERHDGRPGRARSVPRSTPRASTDVPILSYAVKYATAFYGPFRDAAESAPRVRRPPHATRWTRPTSSEALREVAARRRGGRRHR